MMYKYIGACIKTRDREVIMHFPGDIKISNQRCVDTMEGSLNWSNKSQTHHENLLL